MSNFARIVIVTPSAPGSQRGNRVTAERWGRLLGELGHLVTIVEDYRGEECDLVIALHALRSASALARAQATEIDRPNVLVLTGTDLYRDIHRDPRARRSLELASLLVVLHPRGADDLPAACRARTRVVVQSVTLPDFEATPPAAGLQVCVLGHLREVKDPFRAAQAARLLPETSRIQVVQLGASLEEGMAEAARAEEQSNPRYRWLGELPQAEALAILHSSQLHVLSSTMEGGANALCEAIACGVPSLCSKIASSIGILGEDYPGFFPVGDSAALSALLVRAETEPAFYASLKARCAARAELVAPARERAALAELLGELLPGRGRLQLIVESPADAQAEFAGDVYMGLSAQPKTLHCRYFYDAEGSRLFEEICELPEYYPTRCEVEILAARSAELAERFGDELTLFELGSGSSRKTGLLIEALLSDERKLRYVPVDISRTALMASAQNLLDRHPRLEVVGIAAEYRRGLEWLAANRQHRKLVAWLGSNVGNFDRDGGAAFLSQVSAALAPGDQLLLGVDLRKEQAVLEAAYDDAQGVTARFNKNLLTRINQELGGTFALENFAHRASYDVEAGRVTLELVAREACQVSIAALDLSVSFEAGEAIHTEDSYKYSFDELDQLAARSGFRVEERWLDSGERFSLNLLALED